MTDPAATLIHKLVTDFDGFLDLNNNRLVIDGSVDVSDDEAAWIEAEWEKMRPVWDAREKTFWEKSIAEYVEKALAGDTAARERLTYFATRESGYAQSMAADALKQHNLDGSIA